MTHPPGKVHYQLHTPHWKQQSSQSEWRPSHLLMEQVLLLNNKQESLPLTKAMLQHHSKVFLFNKARGTLHPLHKATHRLRNKDLVLHLSKACLHRSFDILKNQSDCI